MSIAATVSQAVLSRHSCRAFADRPVERAIVRNLIEIARYAPSGGNLQPWIVHVLSGDSLARFRRLMAPKIDAAPLGGAAEYHVYPAHLKEPYRTRRFKVGEDMYGHIGVARENKVARIRQFARNFDFFGAPIGMFFLLDRSMGPPQWSDLGMFMQSFMLLAESEGLATCPQEYWARYPKTVAKFVGLPDDHMLFSGMALGYADDDAPINQWRTRRDPIEVWAELRGFA